MSNSDYSDEYEVEKIIDFKVKHGKKLYRIRWKGYSSEQDTWEPRESLNCPTLLSEFHNKIEKKKRNHKKIEELENQELKNIIKLEENIPKTEKNIIFIDENDFKYLKEEKISKIEIIDPIKEKIKELLSEKKLNEPNFGDIYFEFNGSKCNNFKKFSREHPNYPNLFGLPQSTKNLFNIDEMNNGDEPESIIDIRNNKGKFEVLVKWISTTETHWLPFDVINLLFPQILIDYLLKEWSKKENI